MILKRGIDYEKELLCPGTGQIERDMGIQGIGKRCGAKKIPDISIICPNHVAAANPLRMEKEVERSEPAVCSKDRFFQGQGRYSGGATLVEDKLFRSPL